MGCRRVVNEVRIEVNDRRNELLQFYHDQVYIKQTTNN